MANSAVSIESDTCHDWEVYLPEHEQQNLNSIIWLLQATAPMPLQGIQSLLTTALEGGVSELLPGTSSIRKRGVQVVSADYFQSNPNGMNPTVAQQSLLGFLSLLVSYVKGAKSEVADKSPKEIISIMPRTDWTTMYGQVRGLVQGDLYELVQILVCYKFNPDGAT